LGESVDGLRVLLQEFLSLAKEGHIGILDRELGEEEAGANQFLIIANSIDLRQSLERRSRERASRLWDDRIDGMQPIQVSGGVGQLDALADPLIHQPLPLRGKG